MQPLRVWSFGRVFWVALTWIIFTQIALFGRMLMTFMATLGAHPEMNVYGYVSSVAPPFPGAGLLVIGPPLVLVALWWRMRTLQSGMSQTEPGSARVSDRAWFWKINGLSVVLVLLSLLISYLARSRPNSPMVLLGFGLFVVAWIMGPLAVVVRLGRAIRRRRSARQLPPS